MSFLLCDYAASDAIAGVAGGVGFVVVGFGVDDDRGAAVAEQRVRAFPEGYVVVLRLDSVSLALRVDCEILHVAGVVAFGILQPMLLGFGIEVRARGLEVRSIALWVLMKVDAVLAGREVVELKLEAYAGALLPETGGANAFTLGVLQFNDANHFALCCAGKHGQHQNCGEGDEGESKMFHAGNYSQSSW